MGRKYAQPLQGPHTQKRQSHKLPFLGATIPLVSKLKRYNRYNRHAQMAQRKRVVTSNHMDYASSARFYFFSWLTTLLLMAKETLAEEYQRLNTTMGEVSSPLMTSPAVNVTSSVVSSQNGSSTLSNDLKVGLGVGLGVGGSLVLAACLFFWCLRHNEKKKEQHQRQRVQALPNTEHQVGLSLTFHRPSFPRPAYVDISPTPAPLPYIQTPPLEWGRGNFTARQGRMRHSSPGLSLLLSPMPLPRGDVEKSPSPLLQTALLREFWRRRTDSHSSSSIDSTASSSSIPSGRFTPMILPFGFTKGYP